MLLCYLPSEAVSKHVHQHTVTVLHARRQHSHSIHAKAKVGELLPALRADSISTAVSHENIQTPARALLHCTTSSDFTDRCTSKAADFLLQQNQTLQSRNAAVLPGRAAAVRTSLLRQRVSVPAPLQRGAQQAQRLAEEGAGASPFTCKASSTPPVQGGRRMAVILAWIRALSKGLTHRQRGLDAMHSVECHFFVLFYCF